jgi:protocatechuate 3,4-dioxygenase alpha subunit
MTSRLAVTPGQTVGPFFGFALPYPGDSDLIPATHPDAVHLTGLVLDGNGQPVPDALIEIWQPDAAGSIVRRAGSLRRDGFTFTGWGRSGTDNTGRYRFSTLRPGGVAPFFAVTVFARGLLDRLFTRAYLPGFPPDGLLASLAPERRATLVATADGEATLRFDVRLQGPDETVFLRFDGPEN